jgi:hypothetical protein
MFVGRRGGEGDDVLRNSVWFWSSRWLKVASAKLFKGFFFFPHRVPDSVLSVCGLTTSRVQHQTMPQAPPSPQWESLPNMRFETLTRIVPSFFIFSHAPHYAPTSKRGNRIRKLTWHGNELLMTGRAEEVPEGRSGCSYMISLFLLRSRSQ